jgi:HK97 family phage major capsid protein
VTAAVTKHVDFISVTEELLEDSMLLPAYFKRLAARKMALAQNLDVVTAMRLDTTDAGVEGAVEHVTSLVELTAAKNALLPDFRPGAGWFMHDDTLEYIRTLASLIAAPYQFWEYGRGGGARDSGTLLGYPVYTDANWGTNVTAVSAEHYICFANLKYGLAMVENPNIGITVNPYLAKGTGWVRFYLGSRWCHWVTQPLVAFSSIVINTH